jgi:serine/threonine protein kinase
MTTNTAFIPCSRTIEFTSRTYKEEIRKRGTEPEDRSLSFVSHLSHLKWHIKLTFRGTLQSAQTATFARVTKRREDLENLCLCIDFEFIHLLNDTVTELIVTHQHDAATSKAQRLQLKTKPDTESEYASIADHLWLSIREDPFRVRFPVYNSGGLTKDVLDIEKKQELGTGVHKVCVHGEEKSYVYKEVDRPLYEPRDSEVLEQELRNLERLRGTEGVVQLVAAVVSDNPYRTSNTMKNDTPAVLRGILLEYHPSGTLHDVLQTALQSPKPKKNFRWHRWAVQITSTLAHLHQVGITHMDLKPENIVLSEGLDTVLTDLSGIGGTTRKWLSPEMKILSDPLSKDMESRRQNDVWALGKILSAMAEATCNEEEGQVLRQVSLNTTAEVPLRGSLQDAISILSQLQL